MKIHTIQLNIGNFYRDISCMRGPEVSAYTLLMITCYHTENHRVPDDNGVLAMIARVSPKVWAKIRMVVLSKFFLLETSEGRFWTLPAIQNEIIEWGLRASQNKDNVLKRWNKEIRTVSNDQYEMDTIHNPTPNTHNTKHPLKCNDQAVDKFLSGLPEGARGAVADNAPGWDQRFLAAVYLAGEDKRGGPAKNASKAFPVWCKAYTKGKRP